MFEVGKRYEFHMIEGDGEVTFWDTIESYDHPLVKLADSPASAGSLIRTMAESGETLKEDSFTIPARFGRIINVTSPHFISAQRAKP